MGFVAEEQLNRFKLIEDVAERGGSPGVFPALCPEEPLRTEVSFRSYYVSSQGMFGSTKEDEGGLEQHVPFSGITVL